jgi:hypothetical protein
MASPLRSLAPASRRAPRPAHEQQTPPVDGRPDLQVVPARRQFAWFAMAVIVVAATLLMGAAYLHTRLAERQLEIDHLDRALRSAQEEFDVLRAERAVLRSPTRLATEASELGMIPGAESEFVPVDPMLLATVIAQSGQLPTLDEITPGSYARLAPIDQYRLVKTVSQEMP